MTVKTIDLVDSKDNLVIHPEFDRTESPSSNHSDTVIEAIAIEQERHRVQIKIEACRLFQSFFQLSLTQPWVGFVKESLNNIS